MNVPYTVRECLQGYNADTLGALCASWGLPTRSKELNIRSLEQILESSTQVARLLANAPGDTLRLIHLVSRHPLAPLADILSVRGLYTGNHHVESLRVALQHGWILVAPRGSSGAFALSDLTREYRPNDPSPSLFVPTSVQTVLPAAPVETLDLPRVPEETVTPDTSPVDWTTNASLEFLRLVDIVQPRVTAGKTLHRADWQQVLEEARNVGIPSESLTVLCGILQTLQCVAEQNGRLVVTPKAEEWVRLSQSQRARDLFLVFVASEDLYEMTIFFPESFSSIDAYAPAGTLRRTYFKKLAAYLLSTLDASSWYGVQSFVDLIKTRDRNVLFLEEPWRAIQAHARGDIAVWRDNAWRTHEERLYQWMLRAVFAGMGVIQLGNQGNVFRLTPQGMFACKGAPIPETQSDELPQTQGAGDAIVVQPDFEVIAFLDRCTPELRRRLDAFCDRIRPGQATTYRITDESIRRGINSGFPLEGFLRVLEESSARPLPANVRDQFTTWIRKRNAIVIRTNCRLLECLSEKDARTLAKNNDQLRLIGTRFLLCENTPCPHVDTVVSYSQENTPFLEPAEGLQLKCPWEKWNLFHTRRLESLGRLSRTSNGDLLFSPAVDKKALQDDWQTLLDELQSLTVVPLPPRYRTSLRAYAEGNVVGKARTVTLVRFEDIETADAVMELAGVSGVIEGRLGNYTVVVRKARLPELKRILKAHGIRIITSAECWDDTPVIKGESAQAISQPPGLTTTPTDAPKTKTRARSKRKKNVSTSETAPAPQELPSYSTKIMQEILEDAIQRRRLVLIAYESSLSARADTRVIKPVMLDLHNTPPVLNAFCCKQNVARQFKLSQIRGIRVLENETF